MIAVPRGGLATAEFSDEASSRGMGSIRDIAVWGTVLGGRVYPTSEITAQ